MYINTIEISEAVRKGDSGHSIKIVLVPTDSLIFEVAYGLDYSNGSAIVFGKIWNIYFLVNYGIYFLGKLWDVILVIFFSKPWDIYFWVNYGIYFLVYIL